jgi:uncharacterized protein (TIGR02118 family)
MGTAESKHRRGADEAGTYDSCRGNGLHSVSYRVYTVIYELYRRPEISQQEFVSYWLETHRPIAMRMPHLSGYRLCPVTESEGVEGEAVAGFVMLDFESREAFEKTHVSLEFEATAEDAANFARHFTRYAIDVHVAIPEVST